MREKTSSDGYIDMEEEYLVNMMNIQKKQKLHFAA